MSTRDPFRGPRLVLRLGLIFGSAMAVAWGVVVFPVFWSENQISSIAKGIRWGEAYKSEVLDRSVARVEADGNVRRRASALGKSMLIRLRRTEEALAAGDADAFDRYFASLTEILTESLAASPTDSFLWLLRFWAENQRVGLRPEHMRYLRMSYDLGRYEGWIAYKRDRFALAAYSALPPDLADLAVAEFVNFVRWNLVSEAAELAAGPGRALRQILFAGLKDLKHDQRRKLASLMYQRDLDDVLVPGIDPPQQPYQMPILPPGY